MTEQGERSGRIRAFLESGGQVVGNAAGVAVSVVAGPLLGTSAGVAMGEALARVGAEFYDRVLAPRQLARAGGALSIAVARVGERLDAGDELRTDGFFDTGSDGRADADEVLEGTLMTAANAWEERKVAPLGRLYANLAFDGSTSAGWANYLLRVSDGLTYNQLVLLAVIQEAEKPGGRYERAMVNLEAVPSVVRTPPDDTLYAELDRLSSMRLVGVRQNTGKPVPPSDTWGESGWKPSALVRATLMPTGRALHDLMELDSLPRSDRDTVLNGLTGDRDP